MPIWKKENLKLIQEKICFDSQQDLMHLVFNQELYDEVMAGVQQPSTPTTTTTRGRRVATGGASSTT
jgi:hypothetical protein